MGASVKKLQISIVENILTTTIFALSFNINEDQLIDEAEAKI